MTIKTRRGAIYIINKFKVKIENQPFRCIMIYQDKNSGFSFIRPMLYKIPLEIFVELFKIFTSYGPPTEVDVNSCTQDMINSIDNYMQKLCPTFNVKFIKVNANKNNIALVVVNKLHKWMEITNKQQWEIGCCIVQRQINTEVTANNLSPHDRFFKSLGKTCDDNESDAAELDEQNTTENALLQVKESENTGSLDKSSPLKETTAVRVKKEVEESDDINALSTNLSNYVIIYDGGISFPSFKSKSENRMPVQQE